MSQRAWSEEHRTTHVCIDSYQDGVPQGRFYNAFLPKEKSFCGLFSFLQDMEETLDYMDFPRAYTARRSFASPRSRETGPPEKSNPKGNLATFAVRILFRQNTSWQGSVTWLEGKKEESFRSVLELLLLMGSALNSQNLN